MRQLTSQSKQYDLPVQGAQLVDGLVKARHIFGREIVFQLGRRDVDVFRAEL